MGGVWWVGGANSSDIYVRVYPTPPPSILPFPLTIKKTGHIPKHPTNSSSQIKITSKQLSFNHLYHFIGEYEILGLTLNFIFYQNPRSSDGMHYTHLKTCQIFPFWELIPYPPFVIYL